MTIPRLPPLVSSVLLGCALSLTAACAAETTVSSPGETSSPHDDAGTTDILDVTGSSNPLELTAEPGGFGAVAVGEEKTVRVRVVSSRADAVVLAAPVIGPKAGVPPDHVDAFTVAGAWEGFRALEPGSSVEFDVTFAPSAVVALDGALAALRIDVGGEATLWLELEAKVVFALADVSPSSLVLTQEALATSATPFTVRNRGNIPLELSSVDLAPFSAPVFSVTFGGPISIPPKEAISVELVVAMTEGPPGSKLEGELVVTSNSALGPERVSVQVWRAFGGNCSPVFESFPLDFGARPNGTATEKTLVVRNVGGWPCSFAGVRVGRTIGSLFPAVTEGVDDCPVLAVNETYNSPFEVVSMPLAVKDGIGVGEAVEITVAFRPLSSGIWSAGTFPSEHRAALQVLFYDSSRPTVDGPELVVAPPGEPGTTIPCNLAAVSAEPWVVTGSIVPTPVGCENPVSLTVTQNELFADEPMPICELALDPDCEAGLEITSMSGLAACDRGAATGAESVTVGFRLAPESEAGATVCELRVTTSSPVLPESSISLAVPATSQSEWFTDPTPGRIRIAADQLPTVAERDALAVELSALREQVQNAVPLPRVLVTALADEIQLSSVAELQSLPSKVVAVGFPDGYNASSALVASNDGPTDAALLILRWGDDDLDDDEKERIQNGTVFLVSGDLSACTYLGVDVAAAPATAALIPPERRFSLCKEGWGAEVGAALVAQALTRTTSYVLPPSLLDDGVQVEFSVLLEGVPCNGGWSIEPEVSEILPSLVFDPAGPCMPHPGEQFEIVAAPICPI